MIRDTQIHPNILSQICRTEARFLTRDEINAIAEYVKFWYGDFREGACCYFWLTGLHEPANGRCLEVNLTPQEAWWVDCAIQAIDNGNWDTKC